MHGPILLHCVTQKGRGYSEAERDPSKYHGVSPLEISTTETEGEARPPEKLPSVPSAKTFTDVFASAVIDAADRDPGIVAITAAMPTGTGLAKFQERFPERFHDVGICEQHAVTFAAGLAAKGSRPVCALYSTFLQRGYDQIIHDVCLQNLPVLFAVDRAGLVGQDCPTHIGTFDLSFLRSIPNLTLLAPRDDVDLTAMVHWALKHTGPVAIRYPRDKAPTIGSADSRDVTRGSILRNGADAMLAALGPCVGACLEAAELLEQDGLSVGVADARIVKPLDGDLFTQIGDLPLVTVEENVLAGGFGSAVMEYYEMTGRLSHVRLRRVGLPDRFIDHAKRGRTVGGTGPGRRRRSFRGAIFPGPTHLACGEVVDILPPGPPPYLMVRFLCAIIGSSAGTHWGLDAGIGNRLHATASLYQGILG